MKVLQQAEFIKSAKLAEGDRFNAELIRTSKSGMKVCLYKGLLFSSYASGELINDNIEAIIIDGKVVLREQTLEKERAKLRKEFAIVVPE